MMAKDDSGPAFDSCWMVWFRQCLQPDGKWYAWEYTHARTRAESIEKYTLFRKGIIQQRPGRNFRNMRRRGVIKCVRTTLSDSSPLEIKRTMLAQEAEDVRATE